MCALVCDLVGEAECVPTFAHKSKRGPFVREVENRDEKRFETALRRQLFCAIRGSDFRGKTELFKPDFWTVKAVRFYHKIKRGAPNRAPLAHKAPQCGAFRGFETAV